MTPSRFVTSGDVQLALYTWGKPKGQPTILLVHGYPDSAHVWQAVAEGLSQDHFVVAYDVRGAGHSTRPERTSDYALPLLVRDMEAVLEAVAPDRKVHLVAHDWGSVQSWEVVCDERLEARFASFTSMSGPCLDHMGLWARDRLRDGSPDDFGMLASQLSHSWYVGMFELPGVAPNLVRLAGDALQRRLAAQERISHAPPSPTFALDAEYGIHLYRANVSERLKRPTVRRTSLPVHLLCARGDRYLRPEIWDGLSEWAPNLYRSEVDSMHWLQLQQPNEVVRQVRTFVRHVDGEGKPPLSIERARRYAHRAQPRRGSQRGKLVVVTGAGSGFGRETALLFAREGADIVAVDLQAETAAETARRCEEFGVSAWSRQVDVGDSGAMHQLAEWVYQQLGAPDVVVNNAGIGLAGSFFETTDADWERLLRVNLGGVILGARLFGQQMKNGKKPGHIVNVASMAAYTPSRGLAAYATSKAAVRMLSDCLRAELADERIHVSTICPGLSITNITATTRFVGLTAAQEARQQAKATRLYQRRNLRPATIAGAILDAVERRRDDVPVGSEAHGARWLARLSPALLRRLARVELSA